jgi:FkbM family methyltransferase
MGVLQRLWGLRSHVYALLDRPGTRPLLGFLATKAARRETGDDVGIAYRGAWFARYGGDVIASTGSARFVYRHGNDIAGLYRAQFDDVGEMWFHRYEPKAGDVIIDVGAGIGTETFVFSRAIGPQGRVLAIEAHPTTFRILRAQVRANRLDNVLLCPLAVTDVDRAVFIEDRQRHERNTISSEWAPGLRRQAVPGLPLDDICRRFGVDRVDFLKMNIEGAEMVALPGMLETIGRTHHVCIACHDFLGAEDERYRTRERVLTFLRDRGFRQETRDDDPRSFVRDHVHAVNEALADEAGPGALRFGGPRPSRSS